MVGAYWGYNTLTNILPTSRDIRVRNSPKDKPNRESHFFRTSTCCMGGSLMENSKVVQADNNYSPENYELVVEPPLKITWDGGGGP